ncbi:hypothetical protein EDB85DRAFT_2007384 [Lactarius pseudohatsudake]|nr:hypothetical protein EDB85DRAFT_2007384 [Lactarius pseudohatsudake]
MRLGEWTARNYCRCYLRMRAAMGCGGVPLAPCHLWLAFNFLKAALAVLVAPKQAIARPSGERSGGRRHKVPARHCSSSAAASLRVQFRACSRTTRRLGKLDLHCHGGTIKLSNASGGFRLCATVLLKAHSSGLRCTIIANLIVVVVECARGDSE